MSTPNSCLWTQASTTLIQAMSIQTIISKFRPQNFPKQWSASAISSSKLYWQAVVSKSNVKQSIKNVCWDSVRIIVVNGKFWNILPQDHIIIIALEIIIHFRMRKFRKIWGSFIRKSIVLIESPLCCFPLWVLRIWRKIWSHFLKRFKIKIWTSQSMSLILKKKKSANLWECSR